MQPSGLGLSAKALWMQDLWDPFQILRVVDYWGRMVTWAPAFYRPRPAWCKNISQPCNSGKCGTECSVHLGWKCYGNGLKHCVTHLYIRVTSAWKRSATVGPSGAGAFRKKATNSSCFQCNASSGCHAPPVRACPAKVQNNWDKNPHKIAHLNTSSEPHIDWNISKHVRFNLMPQDRT